MVGLLDLAPLTESVKVSGDRDVTVLGVSALGVAYLLRHFPELRELIVGRDVAVTPELLFEKVPHAIAAIIAAGTGNPGNELAEKAAAQLSINDQMDMLSAIIRLTMPEGLRPFVEKVKSLAQALGVRDAQSGGTGKVPAMNSRKPSKS